MSIGDTFSTMWLVLSLEFVAAIEIFVEYVICIKHIIGDLVYVHLTSQSSEEKDPMGTAVGLPLVQK